MMQTETSYSDYIGTTEQGNKVHLSDLMHSIRAGRPIAYCSKTPITGVVAKLVEGQRAVTVLREHDVKPGIACASCFSVKARHDLAKAWEAL